MIHQPRTINRKSKGFTLIELLVVISIIGILAAFIVASFTSAQQKARDAKRKSDLDAVKKALLLASNDCVGGGFPSVGGLVTGDARYADTVNNNLIYYTQNLNYLKKAPQDPTQTGLNRYNYNNSGSGSATACPDAGGGKPASTSRFLLRATLENGADPSGPTSVTVCSSSGAVAGTPPAGQVYYYVCEP